MKAKILILCTGNSCRSQMAEGYLRSLDNELEVFSAGTFQASKINLHAVEVMKQAGIDISRQYPKNADEFVNKSFDYVITVCDNAKEACPVFTGEVKNRLHIGFDDPYEAKGTYQEVIAVYKRVRDEIMRDFNKFYEDIKSKEEV